jgi:hypothetical protein
VEGFRDSGLVGIIGFTNNQGIYMHQDRLMKTIQDIWKYVDKRSTEECWPWLRGTNNSGYGSITFNGRKCIAHRVAFVAEKGGITITAPKNRKGTGFLLHSCDNRLCCNPDHLSVGTYDDNIQDMKRKGRSSAPRGSCHPKSKMTDIQVIEARRLLALGNTRRQVRELFGVSERIMDRIDRGLSYLNAR